MPINPPQAPKPEPAGHAKHPQHEEGSRRHVIRYGALGAWCSEPMCERNFSEPRSAHAAPQPDAQQAAREAKCIGCGLSYTDRRWIDCVVTNEAWAKIAKRGDHGGLICHLCMDEIAKLRGLKLRASLYWCGDAITGTSDSDANAEHVRRVCEQRDTLEAELAAAHAEHAKLADEYEALQQIRHALMEETVLAGYPGGDRSQTLANVRAMRAEHAKLREDMETWMRVAQGHAVEIAKLREQRDAFKRLLDEERRLLDEEWKRAEAAERALVNLAVVLGKDEAASRTAPIGRATSAVQGLRAAAKEAQGITERLFNRWSNSRLGSAHRVIDDQDAAELRDAGAKLRSCLPEGK